MVDARRFGVAFFVSATAAGRAAVAASLCEAQHALDNFTSALRRAERDGYKPRVGSGGFGGNGSGDGVGAGLGDGLGGEG